MILPGIMGCVEKLKYADHEIVDMEKFLEFSPQVYMERKGTNSSGVPILDPKQWITGLYNRGIMNLLEIPHFGWGKDANNYIKQLLGLVHGGIMSINVDMIVEIIGLPTDGEKPHQYLDDKTKEKALAKEMKEKYSIDKGVKRIYNQQDQQTYENIGN
jgi:hypothetical protein